MQQPVGWLPGHNDDSHPFLQRLLNRALFVFLDLAVAKHNDSAAKPFRRFIEPVNWESLGPTRKI